MRRKCRKKIKVVKTVIPEVVAYFEDRSRLGNMLPDYRCPECGFGIADDYICCPCCAAELDWKSVQTSPAEFKTVSELRKLANG